MKLVSLIVIVLLNTVCVAHQSNLSTSFLSTTSSGMNVLQITSSLDAFEGEIAYIYGKESYKTPEEFRELVVNYFKENVLFMVNGQDTLHFGTPRVILGHETKIVAEVLDIPSTITSVYFKNTMFKDMPNNQMALMLSSVGFPSKPLELNNENKHTIVLKRTNGNWISQEIKDVKPFFGNTLWILSIIAVLVIAIAVWIVKRSKSRP